MKNLSVQDRGSRQLYNQPTKNTPIRIDHYRQLNHGPLNSPSAQPDPLETARSPTYETHILRGYREQ